MKGHLNKVFVLLIFLFLRHISLAQTINNHSQCGINHDDALQIKNRMLENRRNKDELMLRLNNSRSRSNNIVYVPIQFHIVNKNDGTGGEKVQDVLDNLCKINDDFAFLDIQFYLAGPINFIDLDLLYTNDFNGMANYFMEMYKRPTGINIFIGDEILSSGGGTILGYFSPGLDAIYAIRSSVHGNSLTLTHELGHFLSLPHTFSGWEQMDYAAITANANGCTPSVLPNGDLVENIDRTAGLDNCEAAGDGFCDTEPNYLFGFYRAAYNKGPDFCEHASAAIDPNGKLFRPDLIDLNPQSFKMSNDNSAITELNIKNNFTGNYFPPKTLLDLKTIVTPSGANTTDMWQGLLGDSDSTDYTIGASGGTANIIGGSQYKIQAGYINTGEHYISINVTSGNPDISFNNISTEFTVTSTQHHTQLNSLEINNNSATIIPAGSAITIKEILNHNISGQISSESWTYTILNDIAAGSSITVNPSIQKSSLADAVWQIETTAPYQTVTQTTSDNIMSYYDDNCQNTFSAQQGEAMELDIAARSLTNLYPAPTSIIITTPASGISPATGTVINGDNVNFSWNSVSGATLYHINVYEVNFFNLPVTNGEHYDFMSDINNYTATLNVTKRYAWTVTPLNDLSFCSPLTKSDPLFFETQMNTSVSKEKTITSETKIFPNPLQKQDYLSLEITSGKSEQISISMVNALGQPVIASRRTELQKGVNIYQLNTESLNAGMYLINIETSRGIQNHKLIIEK